MSTAVTCQVPDAAENRGPEVSRSKREFILIAPDCRANKGTVARVSLMMASS